MLDVIQFVALAGDTGVIRFKAGRGEGTLLFEDGAVVHCSTGKLEGTDAFFEMARWGKGAFSELSEVKTSRYPKNVAVPMNDLLDQAASILEGAGKAPAAITPRERSNQAVRQAGHKPMVFAFKAGKDDVMALESFLDEFKDIKGYLASGIMDFTGQVLATHSTSDTIPVEAAGATFNDIFRSAHAASEKIGLEACRTLVVTTPRGLILMECFGVKSAAHFHLIVVLAAEGNQALAKMTMDKLVPQIMDELK